MMLYCIIIFITSCNSPSTKLFLDKESDLIQFNKSYELTGENIPLDIIGASNLYLIDSFLLVLTPQLDTLYSILSTEDFTHIANFGTRGNGPNEFIRALEPLSNQTKENNILIQLFNNHQNQLLYWNLTASLNQGEIIFKDTVNIDGMTGIYKVHYLDDDALFIDFIDVEKLNQKYGIYHIPTHKITDTVEALRGGMSEKSNSYLLASSTVFSLKNRKYVSAMKFVDQINFYNIADPTDSKCFSMNKKQKSIREVEKIEMPKRMEYYNDLRSNASNVFALYANQNRKDWALNGRPATIQVFDWGGNPICELKTKEQLVQFDIDSKNNILYGLTNEEKIFIYPLHHIPDLIR